MTTPPTAPSAAELTALVEEATKKSGLVWVNGQALWHAWVDGAMCVVGGPGEQPLPRLTDGGTARVAVRSRDKWGRLVSWNARVRQLAPGGEQWAAAAAELKGKRLNSPHGEAIVEWWGANCRLFRLEPDGLPEEYPGMMSADSGAAVPVPSGATTRSAAPSGLPRLLAGRRRT
jgi:hypothetical protein